MEFCEGGQVNDIDYLKEHKIDPHEVWVCFFLSIKSVCSFTKFSFTNKTASSSLDKVNQVLVMNNDDDKCCGYLDLSESGRTVQWDDLHSGLRALRPSPGQCARSQEAKWIPSNHSAGPWIVSGCCHFFTCSFSLNPRLPFYLVCLNSTLFVFTAVLVRKDVVTFLPFNKLGVSENLPVFQTLQDDFRLQYANLWLSLLKPDTDAIKVPRFERL